MSVNINYYRKREQKHQEKMNMSIYSESERITMILEEQKKMVLDAIDKLYEDFSTDYKLDKGMLERQASKFDVQAFLKDAERIVKNKDMSYASNYKMRMYDVKQKVSRLELLLNQINLEMLNTNEETTAKMNDILTDVKKQELERQANLFKMNSNHIQVVNKALMRNSIKGAKFSEYWGNDLSQLYNQLDIAVKRAVTNGEHPYKLKNDVNKMFNTIDSWSKRILITEATRMQSLTQIESFKTSGYKYFRFIAEKTACDHCKPFDDKVYKIEDYEKMMAVPPLHPYCRCSLVPATEEEYQEYLAIEKNNIKKQSNKKDASLISDSIKSEVKDNMLKAWGEEYTNKFIKSFNNLPKEDIRTKLLKKELNGVSFMKLKQERSFANGSSVQLTKKAFDGAVGKLPLETVYHEIGHAVDSILLEKYSGTTIGVPTGNLIKKGKYKIREMAHQMSGHPDFSLGDKINQDVWKMVNGDLQSFEELGKKPRKKAEKVIWEEQSSKIFKESRENELNFVKEWAKKPKEQTSGLSDIMESTPYFVDYPLGFGHGKKYYKNYGAKETEFVAHYFEALMNEDKQEILNKYFKESINELEKILKEAMEK